MLTGTQQLRSQSPVLVHVHFTGGVTTSEGREGVNEDGNEVGRGNEGGSGEEDGDGAGT